jgi:hypothetical protein
MSLDQAPDAMVDLEEVAALFGLPPRLARIYLDAADEPPVASYHGRLLWLSDTVHALIAEAAERKGTAGP